MSIDNRRFLTRLLVALDVIVLIGALAAVGANAASSSKSTHSSAGGSGPTSSLPSLASAGGGADTAGLPPLPTTSLPGSSTSAPQPTGPTTTVPLIVTPASGQATTPGPVSPTPPGTYVYTASVQSSRGTDTTTLTEKVVDESNTGGELRQSVTDTSSDNSANGHTEVSWRSNGLYIRSQDFTMGGSTYTCTFASPVLELSLPLAVGKQWPIQGTCVVTFAGQQETVKLNGSAKVSGIDRVNVGGQAVNVWVGDSAFDIVGTGAIPLDIHEMLTRRLTAAGVVVADTSTMTNVPFTGTVKETRQLHSLEPT
jgi:hypothetical protein